MVYDSVTFELPAPKPVSTGSPKFPFDLHKWFVKVPVLRNSKKLETGDLLCLPFFDENEIV